MLAQTAPGQLWVQESQKACILPYRSSRRMCGKAEYHTQYMTVQSFNDHHLVNSKGRIPAMRVYISRHAAILRSFVESGALVPVSGAAFAVTPTRPLAIRLIGLTLLLLSDHSVIYGPSQSLRLAQWRVGERCRVCLGEGSGLLFFCMSEWSACWLELWNGQLNPVLPKWYRPTTVSISEQLVGYYSAVAVDLDAAWGDPGLSLGHFS